MFSYTPTGTYIGADSFTFTVTDTGNPPGTAGEHVDQHAATVSLTVGDTAPVANPDTYSLQQDNALAVAAAQGVLANDTDARGQHGDGVAAHAAVRTAS